MFKYVNFSIISIKVIHRHIIADICDDLTNVEYTWHSQVRVCLVYNGSGNQFQFLNGLFSWASDE